MAVRAMASGAGELGLASAWTGRRSIERGKKVSDGGWVAAVPVVASFAPGKRLASPGIRGGFKKGE